MIPSDKENNDFRFQLNDTLKIFFKDAVKVSIRHPSQALFFLKTLRWQKKASKTRENFEQQNVHVPPIMIFSVTQQCNLNCLGCYAKATRQGQKKHELTEQQLQHIMQQAHDLGISFVVVAGGEPLMRQDLFPITKQFPDMIFTIFTNGLLIDEEKLHLMRKQKNIVPLISLEGCEEETDARRGQGIYGRLTRIMETVKKHDIFFGTSLTLTSANFDSILSESFIQTLYDAGCKFFLFLEYNPLTPGTEHWMVTPEQRKRTMDIIRRFRTQWPALFVAVPADEEEIGGCLSAGRGFVHVSASGDLEPCPFAPYSDVNLITTPFKEALQSEFLRKIRENHDILHETGGSCALWEKRDWVQSLLHTTKK